MVMDKVTVHVMCARIFLGACVFFPLKIHPKTGEGLGRPLSETLSIRAGCDPGGRLWSGGVHAHPGRVQGSAAVLGEPVELQDSLDAEGWGTLGSPPFSSVQVGSDKTPSCH